LQLQISDWVDTDCLGKQPKPGAQPFPQPPQSDSDASVSQPSSEFPLTAPQSE
jgi:hypothetical protein